MQLTEKTVNSAQSIFALLLFAHTAQAVLKLEGTLQGLSSTTQNRIQKNCVKTATVGHCHSVSEVFLARYVHNTTRMHALLVVNITINQRDHL